MDILNLVAKAVVGLIGLVFAFKAWKSNAIVQITQDMPVEAFTVISLTNNLIIFMAIFAMYSALENVKETSKAVKEIERITEVIVSGSG